jgi:hypothetical protein
VAMSFIEYKKIGNKEYAYETTSYWNKKLKQPRHKSKYLGVVVDKKQKIFKKPLKERLLKKIGKEKPIVDFGDAFLLRTFLEQEGFLKLLKDTFGEKSAAKLFSLVAFKLCQPHSAMRLAETWQSGSAIKYMCKVNLKSQRISELLTEIGIERNVRSFFEDYLFSFMKASSNKSALVLDVTALPNQINMPFLSRWSYHDESIEKAVKLMLVVDKENLMPLFFRYVPGSIMDVSTLENTMHELRLFGVKSTLFVFDAGFYSENNLRELRERKVDFVVRLPANRRIYKKLIHEDAADLESLKYGIKYGDERALFVKKCAVDLFGEDVFAYIILDPVRKGREVNKMILREDEEEDEFSFKKKGIMILLSSVELSAQDALNFYYSRQCVEQLFRFSKDDLGLLPLRVHKEESMRGYLLLMFLSLIAFSLLRKRLREYMTVEEALLHLRNLKAKVFEKEDEMVVQEMRKKQKGIFKRFDIIVPKVAGI